MNYFRKQKIIPEIVRIIFVNYCNVSLSEAIHLSVKFSKMDLVVHKCLSSVTTDLVQVRLLRLNWPPFGWAVFAIALSSANLVGGACGRASRDSDAEPLTDQSQAALRHTMGLAGRRETLPFSSVIPILRFLLVLTALRHNSTNGLPVPDILLSPQIRLKYILLVP